MKPILESPVQPGAAEQDGTIGLQDIGATEASEEIGRQIAQRRETEDALYESRRRHQRLIESLPVGIFRIAPDEGDQFLLANHSLAEMLGYSSSEDFLQTGMPDAFQDGGQYKTLHARLMREGTITAEEVRLKKEGRDAALGGRHDKSCPRRHGRGRIRERTR